MARKPKRYLVRLEDPDSEHFRETTLSADSESAAKEWCEERERRAVAFTLPDDELKELKAKDRADLRGADKGRLFTHEQSKPYKVVSVKALG